MNYDRVCFCALMSVFASVLLSWESTENTIRLSHSTCINNATIFGRIGCCLLGVKLWMSFQLQLLPNLQP